MPTVVGVAFRPVTKVYYFDPLELSDLQPDEYVVVETSRGRTLGQVVFAPAEVGESRAKRIAEAGRAPGDGLGHGAGRPDGRTASRRRWRLRASRARALGMTIKIDKVEFSFDGSSAVVYFTSEQRVDFRNLVHDLSQALHTRVEMRQVGVRDEAKFIGGFGKCGRELCCATWLREFTPVSIKMAKTQDLPLNAPEVSGVCGRLLCCLAYENDFYSEARKQMPRINSIVETPDGPGQGPAGARVGEADHRVGGGAERDAQLGADGRARAGVHPACCGAAAVPAASRQAPTASGRVGCAGWRWIAGRGGVRPKADAGRQQGPRPARRLSDPGRRGRTAQEVTKSRLNAQADSSCAARLFRQ